MRFLSTWPSASPSRERATCGRKKDPSQQFLDATARIHDGYAIKLVQDIIAELKTLGYHWEISPDGYNWAAFAEEQAARKELAAEADHYLQGKTPTCA